ncbi:peptide chain release factor 1 [Candidatus Saccharibacteria bacterium]|nr:peptide chain release factor 1 [Candidatus Saccharibacteria bacterium]
MNIDAPALASEKAELEAFLADPNAFSDPSYTAKSKRLSEIDDILQKNEQVDALKKQINEADGLIGGDDELAELAKIETAENKEKLASLQDELAEILTPSDPNDSKNVIIEIRAGAGGDEASLFASELLRSYLRYCETNNFKTEIMSENANDVGGYKEVVFEVKGDSPYASLKFESGVHRVQRIPATESQGRVHTSTVTVAVLPEAEETDIEINPNDLKVDVYRSGGHGGQSVNTTDSAVRITHLPTGMVVTNQDEKSQIKNKAKAMSVLRSRLLQQKIDEESAKESEHRKSLIGSGDRSEKIRTYNFPQDRITDHRIGYSRSNIPAAMNGDIQDLIDELRKAERELTNDK